MVTTGASAAALQKKLLSQAVQDPLFDDALDEAASEILSESEDAPNEATVESAFERILYAVLKQVGLAFKPTKEAPIETRIHVAKGRADRPLARAPAGQFPSLRAGSRLLSQTLPCARSKLLSYNPLFVAYPAG
jgi:hypothetical protein